MKPIQFGTAGRRMVGLLHPAGARRYPTQGVLLCPAFGQEAIRAHRMYRVLAERLASQGSAVLRFDYFATGDSSGDGIEGDLDGWARDVQTAHQELVARVGVETVVWVGMRLGAVLACQAAHDPPARLTRLVLWDPISDGARYLTRLRERHVELLRKAFSLTLDWAPTTQADRDPTTHHDEAIGFALSAQLRAQLCRLRFESLWTSLQSPCVVISDPSDDDGREILRLEPTQPGRATIVALQHGTDWTSDSSDNGAVLPAHALIQLAHYVGGGA